MESVVTPYIYMELVVELVAEKEREKESEREGELPSLTGLCCNRAATELQQSCNRPHLLAPIGRCA
jgi:hypothetical protein